MLAGEEDWVSCADVYEVGTGTASIDRLKMIRPQIKSM
jgi:hypothetical protein